MIKPALRRLWRDGRTLQLGVDPQRAVVIGGLDPDHAKLVEHLDGTTDLARLRRCATELGLRPGAADHLLSLLHDCGVLEDASAAGRAGYAADGFERDRLAPDAAAASLARAEAGGAVLARRRHAVVGVHGAGRVGASVATLLAAAGVGAVLVEDTATTQVTDLAPAGLAADQLGARRQDAAVRSLRRVSRVVRTRPPSGRAGPDVAVLTSDPPEARIADQLMRAGVPHLYATVRETTGVVGPLVLPGRSSCGRCHDLHRSDRDPAWPTLAAQLAGRDRTAEACDVVLATAVAAQAVLQVLALVDVEADPQPPAVNGTLEITQADGWLRRRSWSPHPACGCTWRDLQVAP